ncbi:hypothetical protein ACFSUD_17940 [Sulfitobacter aestuarii]|uniref:Uncharacterized protein n=1 Tax=Sulfitobacter aestuarii TaxID=2161676 RepID=A0ABW5U801_9RHOB
MPRELDLSKLSQFEPDRKRSPEPQRAPVGAQRHVAAPKPEDHPWPSREPMVDGQISIKAPQHVLARFKKLCKEDRRTYADMLEILMNEFDRRAG